MISAQAEILLLVQILCNPLIQKIKQCRKKTIQNIKEILNIGGMNYSEFTSFWSVIDVSYSTYNSLDEQDKELFLKMALKKFVKMRHNLYLGYGYTPVSIQVGKDAKSHKASGNLGINKCEYLLKENGFNKLDDLDFESFESKDKIYIFPDKSGKKLFSKILSKYKIRFSWSKKMMVKWQMFYLRIKKIYILLNINT